MKIKNSEKKSFKSAFRITVNNEKKKSFDLLQKTEIFKGMSG